MGHKTKAQIDREVFVASQHQLSEEDRQDFLEFHRIEKFWGTVGQLAEKNTVLIPDGQKFVEQCKAVVSLLEIERTEWLRRKMVELGYPQKKYGAIIDLRTGILTPKPYEEDKIEIKTENKGQDNQSNNQNGESKES
jgi:hypothetical protein